MLTLPRRSAIRAVALTAVAAAAVTTAASAAPRAPVRDCGDIANGGAYAITAQGRGLTCASARAVARALPPKRSCKDAKLDQCVVRGFNCFVAQVGKELYLVSCTSSNQTRFVRFEFGS